MGEGCDEIRQFLLQLAASWVPKDHGELGSPNKLQKTPQGRAGDVLSPGKLWLGSQKKKKIGDFQTPLHLRKLKKKKKKSCVLYN